MTRYNFDDIFIEMTKQWRLVLSEGLLAMQFFENTEDPLLQFWNVGIELIQNSYEPAAVVTILDIKSVELISQYHDNEYIIQGILIIKELLVDLRDAYYTRLIDLTKYFCTEQTFSLLSSDFDWIKQRLQHV